MMNNSEVVINENYCLGCGYCEEFCPKGCLTISGDNYNAKGQSIPTFSNPDECTACGFCVWMCPHLALEVYQTKES